MEDTKTIRIITGCICALFAVLLVRLWQLQIVQGEELKRMSYENRLRVELVPAPRGIIFDRAGRRLVRNAAMFSVAVVPALLTDEEVEGMAQFLDIPPGAIRDRIRKKKSMIEPVALKDGLSFEEVAYVEARLADYPALTITVEQARSYPYGEVGAHLIGYLGKLSPEQAKKEIYRDVPRQAFVGQWGAEKMFDASLRGKPGRRTIEVDALGRQLRVVRFEPPSKGDDLSLSMDIALMNAVSAAFAGRAGAFVALRPSTGEVLGLLSSPSFDPNLFTLGIGHDSWTALTTDPRHPMLNRALQSQFPPGSTFKIVTALAALGEGAVTPQTTFTCTGGISRGPWRFGCWKRGGHGTLSLRRAIVESCDVYFYNAGERAGIDAVARYARALGLGRDSGLRLVEEKSGLIPNTEWKRRVKGESWYAGETLNAAIGQGYVLVTPVQLARMMAVVVSGGEVRELRLTKAEGPPPPPIGPALVDREHIMIVRNALMGVVNEAGGTAHSSRSPLFRMGGKTGTAQVVSQKDNRRPDSLTPYEFRDHAWFVAYAPEEAPEIALAVFVEHGGHGGSVAAPIAKAAVETYLEGIGHPHAPAAGGEAGGGG